MARWKARGRLAIRLVLIEHFSLALTVDALWANVGRNRGVRKGMSHFECKFQGEGVRIFLFVLIVWKKLHWGLETKTKNFETKTETWAGKNKLECTRVWRPWSRDHNTAYNVHFWYKHKLADVYAIHWWELHKCLSAAAHVTRQPPTASVLWYHWFSSDHSCIVFQIFWAIKTASYPVRWILRSHVQYAIEIGSNRNFQISQGSVVTYLKCDGESW